MPGDRPRDSSPACLLTLNGGSSSIKYALYAANDSPAPLHFGQIERLDPADHQGAIQELIATIEPLLAGRPLAGIGHRVVHGGVKLVEHVRIDQEVIDELKRNQVLDPTHLPREIALIEAMQRRFPRVAQVACFDTAFFRELPPVARVLPIPRTYTEAGVRRLGFHGLSYTFLIDELRRVASDEVAQGRVIFAHLGAGASMAAVNRGKPIDTSMAFTPAGGLVMATRPGDLDPGLLLYIMRDRKLSPDQMDKLINSECGLIGVSATTADMRDLIKRRQAGDQRAALAIELFCYQAKKFIGAYAATMGGLDTLVFGGGIGENSAEVRQQVCAGLDFLGLLLSPSRNAASEPIISADDSRMSVRVIRTDEQLVIARIVLRFMRTPPE